MSGKPGWVVVKTLDLFKRRGTWKRRHFVLALLTPLIINQGTAGRLSAAILRVIMHHWWYRKTEVVTLDEQGEGCVIKRLTLLQSHC